MPHSEIPLSRPDITASEIELVVQTLRSGRLALGPRQDQFESMVATRAGCRYGVAVSSGTAGLHLAMLALGLGPGDEVITTPFSFVASANSILYTGATPVFVDIDPTSLNINADLIEDAITPNTRAILAVEAFGNPLHMDRIASVAARHEIPLIEDCCEALGCAHRGRPAGSFGRVGVFAFYPNKQITTGEGGVIVTDDERLAEECRSLRNHGRPIPSATGASSEQGTWLEHERLGFNYRMDELSAALGVAQMDRLDDIIQMRQSVANMYMTRLMDNSEIILPTIAPESLMTWFVFVVRLTTEYSQEDRDQVIRGLRAHDIGAAPYFPCIHLMPHYEERFGVQAGRFPIAERVSRRTIALPFHNNLTQRDVDLVVQSLELMLQRTSMGRD